MSEREMLRLAPIGWVESDFETKFGVPRQSGLNDALRAHVLFYPEYRVKEAFRGLEGFSHLWLLWDFSESHREGWSPTVRPPRLGGNRRLGVFATRSPFRPNPIGLSCVRLEQVELDAPEGPILHICGADLMNGTPIYDIKPYLPYADCRPDAAGGFTDESGWGKLAVDFPSELQEKLPPEKREGLLGVLESDPRPKYQNDPQRVYGMTFAGLEIQFTVEDGVMHVKNVQ